jgi:transcriptional regulator with XRE-family HTH domain
LPKKIKTMRNQPFLNIQAIASAREEKKLSQQDMAEALDISQPAYHNIESGKTQRLKKDQIKKISDVLELPVEKILEQEESTEGVQQNQNCNELKDSTAIYNQYNEINETLLANLMKAKDETIRAKDETISIQREAFQSLEGMMKEFLSSFRPRA